MAIHNLFFGCVILLKVIFFKLFPWLALIGLFWGTCLRLNRWACLFICLPDPFFYNSQTKPGGLKSFLKSIFFPKAPSKIGALANIEAMALHAALVLVFLRHLRLLLNPVPDWIFMLYPWGLWAGYLLPVLLGSRLLRRFKNAGLFWFSNYSDYLPLYLLLFTSATGVMTRLAFPTDLVAVKIAALNFFQFQDLPHAWPGGLFPLHFLCGLLVIAWFPFCKLGHFFSFVLNPRLWAKADRGFKQKMNPNHMEMISPLKEDLQADEELKAYERLALYRKRLKKRWRDKGVKEVLGSTERQAKHRVKSEDV